MKTLAEYLEDAAVSHGHLCAGQILGVRLAMAALERLGISDPRGADRKRLVTFVEIDRCATDAVSLVTGCRLGKRALKFRDFGKMAATFCDLTSGRSLRVSAKESSKDRARELFPHLTNKNEQQMAAYREMSDQDLFEFSWVKIEIPPEDFPGYKPPVRVVCQNCGEGVSFKREVVRDGRTLCRSCAGERYYQVL